MIQIGFYLPDGSKFFQGSDLDNHIDIAFQVIDAKGWQEYFKQSNYQDPVDFLVFNCGALKVGNRYFGKVITFYPSKISPHIQEWINFYKSEGYKIDIAAHPEHMSVHDVIRLFHC